MGTAYRDIMPIGVVDTIKATTAVGSDTTLTLTSGTLIVITADDGNAADDVMVQIIPRSGAFTWDSEKTMYYLSAGEHVTFAGDLTQFRFKMRATANTPKIAYTYFSEK